MTHPNDPVIAHLTYNSITGAANGFVEGLTKREYFAAMAMQGLLSNYNQNGMYGNSVEYPMVEKAAVRQADALIKALNETT